MAEDKNEEKKVHGFSIEVDDKHSQTLKEVVHNWKHNMSREELDHVLRDARHAADGKVHLDDKTTLIHHDGTYTLKKRNL
ncbi:MAG TPA: hypothetical protein VN457_05920 [Chlamydiales bacterium]|nr:hypothetical protein [Chlamydiales bacterium]